jgi:hypothetical protein
MQLKMRRLKSGWLRQIVVQTSPRQEASCRKAAIFTDIFARACPRLQQVGATPFDFFLTVTIFFSKNTMMNVMFG